VSITLEKETWEEIKALAKGINKDYKSSQQEWEEMLS
jgi:hypothetical protein